MNKLLLLALCIILQSSIINHQSYAQAPKKMSYQGGARDAQGNLMVNKDITLRLNIINGVDINTPVYSEVQTASTNAFGLFSLKIGEGQILHGSMDEIDWGSGDHFIAVEMDAENNGHFVAMGLSQLLSVPYAFYAEKSGTAKDLENMDNLRAIDFGGTFGQTIRHNGTDWVPTSNLHSTANRVGIGTTSPVSKLDVNGDINISSGSIITVGEVKALEMDEARNFMMGRQSGDGITTGENNNFIGDKVASGNTTGSNNNMIGYRAGFSNTTGDANIFYGYKSGYSNTTGSNNSFIGLHAGYNSVGSQNNIAIGTKAGENIADGKDNTFVGRQAGQNTTADRNAFIGKDAGISNTTGTDNTYIGYNADGIDTLENATAIGANTSVTASNSVVLGNAANVGIGTSAPADKLHVEGNIRMVDGNQAAGYIPVSDSNGTMTWTDPSSIATATRDIIADSDNDTKIQVEESADEDIIRFDVDGMEIFKMRKNANGYRLLEQSTTASFSAFFGNSAGEASVNSTASTFIGYFAGANHAQGDFNTAVGTSSGRYMTSASGNTLLGAGSGFKMETSNNNTLIGAYAGFDEELGNDNVMIGFRAGYNTEGNRNIFIGYSAGENETGSQKLYIENTNSSNPLIYGEFDNDLLAFNANVGIGTTTPEDKLHVVGNIRMTDGNQAAGYIPVSDSNGTMMWTSPSTVISDQVWGLTGNSGTTDSTNFIGSIDNVPLNFKVNNQPSGRISSSGETFFGYLAGKNNTSIRNTGMGYQSLVANTTGDSNTALGYLSLRENTTGESNVAIGASSLSVNKTGTNNTAVGYGALTQNANGFSNTAIGFWAMEGTQTGSRNSVLGREALRSNITGDENTALGNQAGFNSTGNRNVFLGNRAGYNQIGGNRLYIENSDADKDNALIYGEFDNDILAFNANVGVGTSAPADELHVVGNIRMVDGNQQAGYIPVSDANGTMTWTNPSSISVDAVSAIADADGDTRISLDSAENDVDKIYFDIAGTEVLKVSKNANGYTLIEVPNSGGNAVFFGQYAGESSTTGQGNTFIGKYAGRSSTSGNHNTILGFGSGDNMITGNGNTFIGTYAGLNNLTGSNNVFVGRLTGEDNTGGQNVFLGYGAGNNNTGSNSVFLGYQAGYSASGSNKLYIENSDADSANALIYGEFDNNWLRVNGYLTPTGGIADSDNNTKIQVEESANEDKIRFDIAGTESFRMEGDAFYLNTNTSLGMPTINFHNSSFNATSSIITGADQPPISDGSYFMNFEVKGHRALQLNGLGEVTVNDSYTLPTTDGADGEVLTTDGSGNVSWEAVSGSSSWTTSGNNQYSAVSGNVGIGTTSPSQKLDVDGVTATSGLQVGGGSTITSIIKESQTVNISNIGGNDGVTVPFTVTGAQVGAVVVVTPRDLLGGQLVIGQAWVSATNTVSVRIRNTEGGGQNPPETTFDILVIN